MLSVRCDVWCFMQSYCSSCPISGFCYNIQQSSIFLLRKSNHIRKGELPGLVLHVLFGRAARLL